MRRSAAVLSLLLILLRAAPAGAHVTVQPNEAVAGAFSRFVVRVPNERDRASTVKVEVRFPPLAFVGFEDETGWKRAVTNGRFDEPLDAFGQEITKGVVKVVWSGGNIGPQEFAEFGFSAAMPGAETALTFRATQTYSNGEVVKWHGAPESDEPAPQVKIYDLGVERGEGQLALVARLSDELEGDHGAGSAKDEDSLPVVLAGAGLAVALVALAVALSRRKETAEK